MGFNGVKKQYLEVVFRATTVVYLAIVYLAMGAKDVKRHVDRIPMALGE